MKGAADDCSLHGKPLCRLLIPTPRERRPHRLQQWSDTLGRSVSHCAERQVRDPLQGLPLRDRQLGTAPIGMFSGPHHSCANRSIRTGDARRKARAMSRPLRWM